VLVGEIAGFALDPPALTAPVEQLFASVIDYAKAKFR